MPSNPSPFRGHPIPPKGFQSHGNISAATFRESFLPDNFAPAKVVRLNAGLKSSVLLFWHFVKKSRHQMIDKVLHGLLSESRVAIKGFSFKASHPLQLFCATIGPSKHVAAFPQGFSIVRKRPLTTRSPALGNLDTISESVADHLILHIQPSAYRSRVASLLLGFAWFERDKHTCVNFPKSFSDHSFHNFFRLTRLASLPADVLNVT
jgi:hypothetical protein